MSWYQAWVTPRKLFTKFERNLWRNDIHIFLGTESNLLRSSTRLEFKEGWERKGAEKKESR